MKKKQYHMLYKLERYNPRAARTIANLGFRSVRAMCLACNLDTSRTFEFLRGKINLRTSSGEYSIEARRLAESTGCIPEDFVEDYTHISWCKKKDFRHVYDSLPEDDYNQVFSEISRLSDRERQVVELFFFERRTLREIGDHYRVTSEIVRQIKNRALAKLRKWLSTKK